MDPWFALHQLEANLDGADSSGYSQGTENESLATTAPSVSVTETTIFELPLSAVVETSIPVSASGRPLSAGWDELRSNGSRKRAFSDIEETILSTSVPEEEDNIVAEPETIGVEDNPTVQHLKTELEHSTVVFDRKVRAARGCRCEDVDWSGGEHVSQGALELSLLRDYRGPGLQWKPFLAVYAPQGPAMFEFELGRADQLFYLRAFSSIKSCHTYRFATKILEIKNFFKTS